MSGQAWAALALLALCTAPAAALRARNATQVSVAAHGQSCMQRFMPTVKDACDTCREMSKRTGLSCTCTVGDCTEEMSGYADCGKEDGKNYFCTACAPVTLTTAEGDEYPDGKITTYDTATEKGWKDVHPC